MTGKGSGEGMEAGRSPTSSRAPRLPSPPASASELRLALGPRFIKHPLCEAALCVAASFDRKSMVLEAEGACVNRCPAPLAVPANRDRGPGPACPSLSQALKDPDHEQSAAAAEAQRRVAAVTSRRVRLSATSRWVCWWLTATSRGIS